MTNDARINDSHASDYRTLRAVLARNASLICEAFPGAVVIAGVAWNWFAFEFFSIGVNQDEIDDEDPPPAAVNDN